MLENEKDIKKTKLSIKELILLSARFFKSEIIILSILFLLLAFPLTYFAPKLHITGIYTKVIILSLISMIIKLFYELVISYLQINYIDEEKRTIKDIFTFVGQNFKKYFFTGLCMFLVFLGLYAIGFSILYVIYKIQFWFRIYFLLAYLQYTMILLAIFVILFVLVLLINVGMSLPLSLFSEYRYFSAVKHSIYLVRKNIKRVLALIGVLILPFAALVTYYVFNGSNVYVNFISTLFTYFCGIVWFYFTMNVYNLDKQAKYEQKYSSQKEVENQE